MRFQATIPPTPFENQTSILPCKDSPLARLPSNTSPADWLSPLYFLEIPSLCSSLFSHPQGCFVSTPFFCSQLSVSSCALIYRAFICPLQHLLQELFGSPQLSCSFSPGVTPTTMVRLSKPKTFQAYLDNCHRRYSCVHCRAHLANHDDLISKSFQGSQGRAYLFNSVVNVGCGPAEERVLLTGLHAVADIYCENCKTTLGWKYEQAFETSQKYKEGKFIIELNHMIKDNGWD
ncbi:protein yippee-like 3 isoform X1 [Notechis scutatus]|uniref:Protein yippee-like 3 isoform X1 n=1 Tax=Notechis scutatus TaxID=8663 RepID=A0A6J1V5I4_9SAUR|nr:protein yippee-like 3 isoform X1 [Notechis scutatus]